MSTAVEYAAVQPESSVEMTSREERAISTDSKENRSRSSSIVNRHRALTFSPEAPDNAPTVLTFSDISVKTKHNPPKVLLHGISGSITGGFWAIMGSSGGGKTTLLSTLSLRLDANYMDISGDIRLNGREYSKQTLKAMSAYVMQDDLIHAELTTYETLMYAAELRMAAETTAEQRKARVEEVISLMGLANRREVFVGNARTKGLSGGEKKRLCVAIELLNYPKLLFLDEPTSGLDSTTALTLTKALQNLAAIGECTVVCTIHQPQPKIFNMFDNLILMKRGTIVYQGRISKLGSFLDMVGHPLPQDENMADHLLDVYATNADDVDSLGKMLVPVNLDLGLDKDSFDSYGARSWFRQYWILCRRNFQQYVRNWDLIIVNFVVSALLAIFIGSGLWYQIGTSQKSLATRVPSLFFQCITQGIVGSLQSINSFPGERSIVLRERSAGTYQVSSYFMAKTTVELITQMWPPIVFSCIVYFEVGYQNKPDKFFLYTMFMVLNCLAATSLATLVTCVCVTVEMSTVVLSLMFEICRLFGGFFASPLQVDEIPDWSFLDAISYTKYAFMGVALNELHGLELECTGTQICHGGQIIKQKGYNEYTMPFCVGMLVVYIVVTRLVAYIALRFIKF